jgi:hypothetical protein
MNRHRFFYFMELKEPKAAYGCRGAVTALNGGRVGSFMTRASTSATA